MLLLAFSGGSSLAQVPATQGETDPRRRQLERENAALKRENEELRRKLSGQTAAPAPASTAPRGRPGWQVLFSPRPLRGQEPIPVGQFIARPGGFTFGEMRRQNSPFSGWASYEAQALFKPRSDGPVAFTIELSANEERINFPIKMTCDVGLKVDGNDLIPPSQGKFYIEHYGRFDRTLSGGMKLGNDKQHPILLQVGCQFGNHMQNVTADDLFQQWPRTKEIFDAIRVRVTMFTVDDPSARPPHEDELFVAPRKR